MTETPTPATAPAGDTTARGITITRVFDAPRNLVFKAWTEPARFAQWFGLRDSTVPLSTISMDVRPGGAWSLIMIAGVERTELPFAGVYREVVAPERLVFTLGNPSEAHEVVTVTLTDLGTRTEMVFQQAGQLPEDEYARAKEGWSTFFQRLGEHLAQA